METDKLGIPRKNAARLQKRAAPPRILDNHGKSRVGDFLRKSISGAQMRVVSAYFSIYAHRELREELDGVEQFQFLCGDPRSLGQVDSGEAALKSFVITEDGGMEPAVALTQKITARECADWVRRGAKNGRVQIRTMEKEFLHGKMFHLRPRAGPTVAVCGSSNFTARGLGFVPGNRELNIVADKELRGELEKWFDHLWGGKSARDAKEDVLQALEHIGRDQSPQFVYFLTLYRLFHEELERMEQSADRSRVKKSVVWDELYPFQREAAFGVVSRLKRWGGCVLADSVGLGKTYTALAVMKYFQNQDEHALVLCPKRLKWNWERFLFNTPGSNPLEQDRFDYHVRAHTDLDREHPDMWSKYDLVVIDESHNFRNDKGKRYETLRKALKRGVKTKVLMLSATPVNTSLKDLRNQIRLMADDDAFAEELGIRSVDIVARRAQAAYARWKKQPNPDKAVLPERLGGAFLKLLDAVSIARSRAQIQKHYADSFVGGADEGKKMEAFPETAAPMIRDPETGAGLSYAKIHRDIEKFRLSVYHPSAYQKSGRPLRARPAAEGEKTPFKQEEREKHLIGMMRINFLKRLESSAYSFCQTLDRTIHKMEAVEQKIDRVRGGETELSIDPLDELDELDQEDIAEDGELDEDLLVGERLQYDLRDLRLDEWERDLKSDRRTLEDIRDRAMRVTPSRDAKLAELKKLLRDKAQNPPRDRDGKPNRKTLIFTAFADTAKYLYEQLRDFARDELKQHIALVVGSGDNQSTAKIARPRRRGGDDARRGDILDHFSPAARQFHPAKSGGEDIDILVATDCVSEGQNLQDCDRVVNYDIHWNPVRIIQRFGRVDRIGGRNRRVGRVDFWPHMKLEEYLKLQKRVRAGMALADAVVAGEFREQQLRRLREGSKKNDLVADELGEAPVSDFVMSDLFLYELRDFLEARLGQLKDAPNGLFAVAQADGRADPGLIFCLRRKNPGNRADAEQFKRENRTHPYCLAYVRRGKDGKPEVRLGFPRAKEILLLFRDLCRGKTEPLRDHCVAFDRAMQNKNEMREIRNALQAAVADINGRLRSKTREQLATNRAAKIPNRAEQPGNAADFELVTWLVVR